MAHGFFVAKRETIFPQRLGAIPVYDEAHPVMIAPQESPDPPRRQSEFVGDKFPTRRPLIFFLRAGRWMEDRFLGRPFQPSPVAAISMARQLPWRERANIHVPQAGAYGNQFEVG